ncbi:hypothetical protein FRC12_013616 [Ceratobasidium sp. 428]|nr:hypothetical protein FRC12_013616 [Ceratobasidium sp. 428]
MTGSSLFYDWTREESAGFPATHLAEHLMMVIGANVCAYRRNTQTSYRFMDLSRTLIDCMHHLLQEIEHDANWDAFEQFTSTIRPLEEQEILFDLATQTDVNLAVELLDHSSADKCRRYIVCWEDHRKSIRDALKLYTTRKQFTALLRLTRDDEDDILSAYKHDDRTFLSDLVTGIRGHLVQKKISMFPSQHRSVLGEISTKIKMVEKVFWNHHNLASSAETLIIKSVMAIYGLLELAANRRSSLEIEGAPDAGDLYLSAKNLLSSIINFGEGRTKQQEVSCLYQAFSNQLAGDIVGLPDTYSQIMKSLAKAGMPYHNQSLLVATLCRELAQNYRKRELKNESQYVLLQSALDQCLSTIRATAEVTWPESSASSLTNLPGFNSEHYDQHNCTQLFRDAAEALAACYTKLQTEPVEERLQAAVAKDANRMTSIYHLISKDDVINKIDQASLIQTTVKVQTSQWNGALVGQHTVMVKPFTRLSAIEWGALKVFGLSSGVRQNNLKVELAILNSLGAIDPVDRNTEVGSLTLEKKLVLFVIV